MIDYKYYRELIASLLGFSLTTIIALSFGFLGTVFIFERYGIDIDPEVVFVALVPVVIALLITGRLALKEIQTPSGLKLLLEPLSNSQSSKLPVGSLEALRDIQTENEIIDISKYITPDNEDIELTTEERENLKKYIHDKDTKILSFKLGRSYAVDLIQTCIDAIADDPDKTIQYLLFTNDLGEFEGMLRLSNEFYNRLITTAISQGSGEDWTELAKDMRSRDILAYPGTITSSDAISVEKSMKEALEMMSEKRYSWLPIVNEKNDFVGVVSERQIIRDILLALVDG